MEIAAPSDGIHLTWQYCQNTKQAHEDLSVPFAALVELLAPVDGMHVLQYPPTLCGNCKSALNCYAEIDFERSMWRCPVWCEAILTSHASSRVHCGISSTPHSINTCSTERRSAHIPCKKVSDRYYGTVVLCKLCLPTTEASRSTTCQQSCSRASMWWSTNCQPPPSPSSLLYACFCWTCAWTRKTWLQ